MIDGGDLVRSERDGMLCFALSHGAYLELNRPDGELQTATSEDEATLFDARYRARGGQDANLRRRAEDLQEPV